MLKAHFVREIIRKYNGNSLPCGLSLFLLYSNKTKNIPLRYVFLTKPLADSHTDCLQSLAVLKELLVTYIVPQLGYSCQYQNIQISKHFVVDLIHFVACMIHLYIIYHLDLQSKHS